MSTSARSGLSAEAEEFVPYFPVCTGPSIPIFQPTRPIYPLMKSSPHPAFSIDSVPPTNASQIILLPTSNPSAGFYPSTVPPVFFSSNIPSSNFYPLEPPPPPLYSVQSSGSARISTQSARQPHPAASSSSSSFHPTPRPQFVHSGQPAVSQDSSSQSKGNRQARKQERATVRIHNKDDRFQFRKEDFPNLPIQNEQAQKIPPAPLIATDTKPMTSWTTIVSTPRPQSTSPHPTAVHATSDQQSKESSPTPRPSSANPRSTSVTSIVSSTKDIPPPAPPSTAPKQKSKRNKKKKEAEPVPTAPTPPPPVLVSLPLDDDDAFPALGQQITSSKKSEPNPSTKSNATTPGLIPKAHVKGQQTYQVRLTEMFNALSTSTRPKPVPQQKANQVTAVSNANPLDSNPVPKRGKEREQPKARKPTKLKRIINRELEENQKQRQQLLSKVNSIKQSEDKDPSSETDTNTVTHDPSAQDVPPNGYEYTSASCTEDSNRETEEEEEDDDDDDEELDQQPTSQSQTPFADQLPSSHIKQQIHDGTFREYCSQLIDRQLDELCIQLLLTLKRFQDRKKQQLQANPERARRKRRFVHGIREVTKHLRSQRLKCVLIAPDCQSIHSQGGLNDAIEQIINLCKEQTIPYIFTLNRQKLGRCLNKISRISAIGIFDCSGADQIYQQILDITNENQSAYKQILDNILNHEDAAPAATPSHGLNSRDFYKILHRTFQQQQHPPSQKRHQLVNTIPSESLSKVLPKVPAHHAHSRQTSDTSTIYIDPQLINSINAVKKQHARASSGTFDLGKSNSTTKKNHQRTLSDGAANVDMACALPSKQAAKTHSRTPSGCSAISQIEQHEYFEQSKNILINNNHEEIAGETEESRLKSIHEDTEEMSANSKRKHVADWVNNNN